MENNIDKLLQDGMEANKYRDDLLEDLYKGQRKNQHMVGAIAVFISLMFLQISYGIGYNGLTAFLIGFNGYFMYSAIRRVGNIRNMIKDVEEIDKMLEETMNRLKKEKNNGK